MLACFFGSLVLGLFAVPLPTIRATLVAPEPLLVERSFLRLHNRCAKEALREQGTYHWQKRLPQHFLRSAHARYGYQGRSPKYMRIKARRWHSATDLVKTGHLKSDVLNTPPVIRIGGKASDDDGNAGGLKLTLTLPFHPGTKANAGYAELALAYGSGAVHAAKKNAARRAAYMIGVSIQQMRKELAAITDDEARDTARRFLRGYGQRLAAGLARAPRIRKRVAAAKAGPTP